MKPFRQCALCGAKIREKQRLCVNCEETWKDQLTSNWLSGIIGYAEYEFNLSMRDYKRIISLEKVKNLI